MTYAVKAADELAKEGIEAELIDLRTISPDGYPDDHRIGQEDRPPGHRRGRLSAVVASAAEIATRVMQQAFDYLDAPVLTIAGKDRAHALRCQSREARTAECRRSGSGRQSRLLQIRGGKAHADQHH